MTTIYTLSLKDKIFYVGKTTHPLKQRRKSHLTANHNLQMYAFVQSLSKKEREQIEILQLDECTSKDEKIIETYWIHQMSAWGFSLFNNRLTMKTVIRYMKKDKNCYKNARKII